MTLSIVLFLLGILGFVLNRKNIILMLISIEIMLLAVTVLVIVSSFAFDDIVGQTYSIYIIAIAGAESAIGLGILVAFYRLLSKTYLSLLWMHTDINLYLIGDITVKDALHHTRNTFTDNVSYCMYDLLSDAYQAQRLCIRHLLISDDDIV
jgi:NADH-ubiquinone oxidoreductase chain 4L